MGGGGRRRYRISVLRNGHILCYYVCNSDVDLKLAKWHKLILRNAPLHVPYFICLPVTRLQAKKRWNATWCDFTSWSISDIRSESCECYILFGDVLIYHNFIQRNYFQYGCGHNLFQLEPNSDGMLVVFRYHVTMLYCLKTAKYIYNKCAKE